MKNIDDIHFDICTFSFAEGIREVIVCIDGEKIKIIGGNIEKISDLDFWITPSEPVERIFGHHFKSIYSRFFSELLKALHRHDANTPICGICVGDIARAYEVSQDQANELADQIASGLYALRRKNGSQPFL
jgi:hypothetical protein